MNTDGDTHTLEDRVRLRDGLAHGFSLRDLDELCFDLGLAPDDIPGMTVREKSIEIIAYFHRRARLNELIMYLRRVRPAENWPSVTSAVAAPTAPRVEVKVGNVLNFDCDVLALKYAQYFYGADLAVATALDKDNLASYAPAVGSNVLASTDGKIAARYVLFVGTLDIGEFDYAQIRSFATRALNILANKSYSAKHVAMTIHGVGFGLDETESFLAQIAGILDAVSTGKFPPFLEKISIVERDARRAARLQGHLERYLKSGMLVSRTESGGTSAKARFDEVGEKSKSKPHVFVAMPFSDDFVDAYELAISPSVNAAGYLCERGDTTSFTGDILTRIKTRIETASLVIAELTGANPNVYLEVGYAWGKDRPTLLLVKNIDDLKFDVVGQKSIVYKHATDLKRQLETFLAAL